MAWDFTIDSEKQKELANLLNTESNNYDQRINDMYLEIKNMGNHWTGEDYNKFENGTEGYRPALNDLSDGIRMYAEHLNKIADRTDELSSELINIIENMTKFN